MQNNMYTNWLNAKQGRFAVNFISAFLDHCKNTVGGSKQELVSRFVLKGIMKDPKFSEKLVGFEKDYFRNEHENKEGDADYLAWIRNQISQE